MNLRNTIARGIGCIVAAGIISFCCQAPAASSTPPTIADLNNSTWVTKYKIAELTAGDEVSKASDVNNWTLTQLDETTLQVQVSTSGNVVNTRTAFYKDGLLIMGRQSDTNSIVTGSCHILTVAGTPGKLKFQGIEMGYYSEGSELSGKTETLKGKQSSAVVPDSEKSKDKDYPDGLPTIDDIVGLWQYSIKAVQHTSQGAIKYSDSNTLTITKLNETQVSVAINDGPEGGPFVGEYQHGLLLIHGGTLSDTLCPDSFLMNVSVTGKAGKLKFKGFTGWYNISGLDPEAVTTSITGALLPAP